ncbi:MAG: tripartite tricarboxylate transporter substrate binding protein [Betaproteobacteria bacterium]
MIKNKKAVFSLIILALGIVGSPFAHSASFEDWPKEPIHLLVPFAPGGGVDGAGRMLARALEEKLKVSVVIDNKPGANGTIAMNILKQAKPDGYTLSMVSTGALDVNVSLMNLPYDPTKDFTYIAPMVKFPFYLAVTPASGIKSIQDLVNKAKAEPGKVTYSSPGIGNGIHLAAAMFSYMTGTQMTHVPYKGAAPAAAALLGGEVTFTFGSGPSILGFVEAGKVIALGTSNSERVATMPNLPTINELGIKGYDSSSLGGVVGPAGMPPELVAKLTKAIHEIVTSKEMQDKIYKAGMIPLLGDGVQFEKMIAGDRQKYGDLIKNANMKTN